VAWFVIQANHSDRTDVMMRRDFRDTRREDWKELHVLHTVSLSYPLDSVWHTNV
jgi:hypothetical protein